MHINFFPSILRYNFWAPIVVYRLIDAAFKGIFWDDPFSFWNQNFSQAYLIGHAKHQRVNVQDLNELVKLNLFIINQN